VKRERNIGGKQKSSLLQNITAKATAEGGGCLLFISEGEEEKKRALAKKERGRETYSVAPRVFEEEEKVAFFLLEMEEGKRGRGGGKKAKNRAGEERPERCVP